MTPPLFIGRFQPFHLGHLDAVRQILKGHRRLIIGIGSAQCEDMRKNPWSANLRMRMIRRSLKEAGISLKKITIVKIADIHDDNKWVSHVKRKAPRFNIVYSGSPKVQRLFKKDGKHSVKKPNFNLPISGTKIRRLMKSGGAWKKFVPKSVYKILKRFPLARE